MRLEKLFASSSSLWGFYFWETQWKNIQFSVTNFPETFDMNHRHLKRRLWIKKALFRNLCFKMNCGKALIHLKALNECSKKDQKRFSKQCLLIAFCYFRRFRGRPYNPVSALKMHLFRCIFFGLNRLFNRSFSTRFNVVQSTKEMENYN